MMRINVLPQATKQSNDRQLRTRTVKGCVVYPVTCNKLFITVPPRISSYCNATMSLIPCPIPFYLPRLIPSPLSADYLLILAEKTPEPCGRLAHLAGGGVILYDGGVVLPGSLVLPGQLVQRAAQQSGLQSVGPGRADLLRAGRHHLLVAGALHGAAGPAPAPAGPAQRHQTQAPVTETAELCVH